MNGSSELNLNGIDASNPLAFLAALGTLRTLADHRPDLSPRMKWRSHGHWFPVISFQSVLSESELVQVLSAALSGTQQRPEFTALGDDLSVGPHIFRGFASAAALNSMAGNRATADFAAAFGSEVTVAENETIQDTAFRTMAGAGHQHFLGSMRNIISATTSEHLHKCLFRHWCYDDPMQTLSLRWDPQDDIRYALQWRNPSGDPSRRSSGSMLGANRLAIEGLPMFPTAPRGRRLYTTGFRGARSTDTFWTWPVWDIPASKDVVRSLLSYPELQAKTPDRLELAAMGVREIFRSQRLTIGKVKNFTPGRAV